MSDRKVAFPPLLVLVAILALIARPFTVPRSALEFPNHEKPVLAKNYIVRFLEYRMVKEHQAYLEGSCVGRLGGWRWIKRNNPAAAFPTDFGVVEIHDEQMKELVEMLQQLELVKDVWIDSSYSRNVLVSEDAWKDGTFEEVKKKPGKLFTSMSFEEVGAQYGPAGNFSATWNRKLMMERSQVTSMFGAEQIWAKGYTGAKVKMAIFDTGIRADHPHFRNIKERTNWTNEDTLNDNIGHGTFVAGVIAGEDAECLGFAPDVEIYAFRVFTDAQVSYTSWFLDAFNYAIATDMDVLNLSIGGPDYLDFPFVEKVWELTANNVIMVSAIGNDGPLYGTLNNPADQSDVIGVGGIDYNDHIASFSSRGMSTWELPHGYGRVKPDVVAYGREIMGSKISTGCKSLSGTSVASPVVAGVVCLLVSVIPEGSRKDILNPASMKQALVEGASKLSGHNIYEQGAGRLNLLRSFDILRNYQPRASIFPSILDYTDCPYTWPFCRQPLYAGAMPVIFNSTVLNGMGVIGYFESPPVWQPVDEVGNLLSVKFKYSDVIWPWTGFLAVHLQVKDEGASFSGTIEGDVIVKIYTPPQGERGQRRTTTCSLHLKLNVVPTPPRAKRLLWDQFHNIKYPPGYIPRDSLDVRNDILDWHGDHLHTNYHIMFNMLRDAGYYIETLGSPLTCFDASRYGTLLMVDLEDEYFPEEIEKLRDDVVKGGLGLLVFSEWYNVASMVKMRFFDDNTRSWWTPITGGANIPALNELLAPFGIAFGGKILSGDFSIDGEQSHYASGTDIIKFPGGGYLHKFQFQDNSERGSNLLQTSGINKVESPILGLAEVGTGRIVVYGDSNCLDSSHMVTNCYWLLLKFLDFSSWSVKDPILFPESAKHEFPLYEDNSELPTRRTDINFSAYSAVSGKELICHSDSRFEVWGTKGYHLQLMGRNRKLPGYPTVTVGTDLNRSEDKSGAGWVAVSEKLRPRSRTIIPDKISRSMDFLGLLTTQEREMQMPPKSQWLLPVFVVIACFMLFLSLWRVRQKRRRRRKGSGSSRALNLV